MSNEGELKRQAPEPEEALEYQAPEPEEELEVPANAAATAVRLWNAAAGQRWRLVLMSVFAVTYVTLQLGAVSYSAGLIDLLWGNIQECFARGESYVVAFENGGTEILTFLSLIHI